MLISMTGFATKNVDIKGSAGKDLDITLILKTLNARYFETICKLPFALTHLETEIIKLLKSKLKRGTVYITIQINNPAALKSPVQVSEATLENYIKSIKKAKKEFNLPGEISISDIIQLPHLFEFSEQLVDEKISKKILEEFSKAADKLIKSRKKEGENLEKDILLRIKRIKETLKKIEKRSKIVLEKRKEELLKEFESIITDEPSQAREVQLQILQAQLDKHQIAEEIVRFNTHINNLENVISSEKEEKGKKIDFTIQELFREINTLTAKANDAELSNLAINVKIELEKIREQNQNVL